MTLTESTDGRRIKGEKRKRELIDATLRIVASEGVSGVSHRAVAREAGVPATAAAYYFDGIDDLLAASLTQAMDEDIARMRELAAEVSVGVDNVRKLAIMMAEALSRRGYLLAEYELYLLAVRKPALRESTHRWMGAVTDLAFGYTADPVRVEILLAVVDGMLLQGLLRDEPPSVDKIESILRLVVACPVSEDDRS